MLFILREEFLSGDGVLRFDVVGADSESVARGEVLEEMTFLNYRLASVQSRKDIKKPEPDIIWNREKRRTSMRPAGMTVAAPMQKVWMMSIFGSFSYLSL